MWFSFAFRSEALSVDEDGVAVVEEAVEDGACERGVVAEESRPLVVGEVGGDDGAAVLVPQGEDLEEEAGAVVVDGEVAHLVEDEELGIGVELHLADERSVELRLLEGVDHAHGGLEPDVMALDVGEEPSFVMSD